MFKLLWIYFLKLNIFILHTKCTIFSQGLEKKLMFHNFEIAACGELRAFISFFIVFYFLFLLSLYVFTFLGHRIFPKSFYFFGLFSGAPNSGWYCQFVCFVFTDNSSYFEMVAILCNCPYAEWTLSLMPPLTGKVL